VEFFCEGHSSLLERERPAGTKRKSGGEPGPRERDARRVQYIIPVYYYYYAIAYSTFCWSTMSIGTRRGALHVCLPSLLVLWWGPPGRGVPHRTMMPGRGLAGFACFAAGPVRSGETINDGGHPVSLTKPQRGGPSGNRDQCKS
jgi:hypothetical protein